MALESNPAYSAFRSGQCSQAYNEAAFRHFLALDRLRAARSMRSLLLVLVSVRESGAPSTKIPATTAAALFDGLGECVREVDFVGWYREGYVAAAVLSQGIKALKEVPHLIAERMRHALRKRLSANQSRNLRVRVVRLGGRNSV
jgi:hypothetical protein